MITDSVYTKEFSAECCSTSSKAIIDLDSSEIYFEGLGLRVTFDMGYKKVEVTHKGEPVEVTGRIFDFVLVVYRKHLAALKHSAIAEDWALFTYWYPVVQRFLETHHSFALS